MKNNALNAALHSGELGTFILIAQRVLTLANYGEVITLDRLIAKQKSRFGGCELLCTVWFGEHQSKIVVKVIKDWPRTRMLSELIGTVDRLKADGGLLLATRPMGKRVRAELKKYSIAPIHVFDVNKIAELMIKFGVGVRSDGSPDYSYFGELDHLAYKLMDAIQFIKE